MTEMRGGNRIASYLIGLVLTAGLCWACWWIWKEVPRYLRGTVLADYQYFASLLAVFLFLSLVNPVIIKLWNAFNGSKS